MGNAERANSRLLVRDPITLQPLKTEGEYKPRTTYWLRRIKCGDCELCAPQAAGTVMLQKHAPQKQEVTEAQQKTLTSKKGED